jgi:phosphoribosyl 1,2-cyclic phosphodiesterase/CheY-like chemotaxis protein
MRIRFWGTRGSIATPGPATLRYGGNTACVEVRLDDGTLIVLDCGTGARPLGQALMASGERPIRGHLFISHTHWDHIQGFPFFAPLFLPGNEWDIYAPASAGHTLEEVLAGQMEYTYFPVRLDQLGATIRFHDLTEGTFHIGGTQITTHYLNHPALTLGYRIDAGGASVVYATDHEPHGHRNLDLQEGAGAAPLVQPLHRGDQCHVQFLDRADLVIHDAQFTAAEDPSHIGWGHTAAEQVVDFALAAGVEKLALFHHDPTHDDATLDLLVGACRRRAAWERPSDGAALEITAAAEGESIDLSEDPAFVARRQAAQWEPVLQRSRPVRGASSVAQALLPVEGHAAPIAPPTSTSTADRYAGEETVLLIGGAMRLERLRQALLPEPLRLLAATDPSAGVALAQTAHPDLIVVGADGLSADALEVCRALRRDGHLVPIILVTDQRDAGPAVFEAGATDHLLEPLTPAQIRARTCLWLQRWRQSVRAGTIGL